MAIPYAKATSNDNYKMNIPDAKEFAPCHICIKALRDKLFSIKTQYGTLSYKDTSELIGKTYYDLYTNTTHHSTIPKKINIEHIFPISYILPRANTPNNNDNMDNYINLETYTEPYILFPTFKILNNYRANYKFVDMPLNMSSSNPDNKSLNTSSSNPDNKSFDTFGFRPDEIIIINKNTYCCCEPIPALEAEGLQLVAQYLIFLDILLFISIFTILYKEIII